MQGTMIQDHASMADGRRRITADSFRLLTARLKAKTPPTAVSIGAIDTIPAPATVPLAQPELYWPEPDPVTPEAIVPEPEIMACEPVAELPVEEAASADIALPAFVPLWPLEVEHPEPDHVPGKLPDGFAAQEAMDASTALLADEFGSVSGEPAPQAVEIVDAPPPFEAPAQTPAKPLQPLAERVVDAMLQTVTEAIYAKPTGAERAAFLREVAALIDGEEAGGEIPAALPQPISAPMAGSTIEPPMVLQEPGDIPGTLADKLGPSAALLLKQPEIPDPFSKIAKDAFRIAPNLAETPEADQDSGELALSLLDMMSAGAASGLPQERALAADTLLRMISRIPVKQLIMVSERVAIMEAPPSLLVARLIRDPRAEVVAPLLERCMHITDQDLMAAATEGDSTKRRMIARRRILSPVLADHLISIGDPSTLLTLIRNPGAGFSHEAFYRLAEHASRHHSLLAPLTTRADLPAPVAFELFWFVPQELRRFIFSRFLTDSETLSKILKITLGAQDGGETKFPPRELLESVIDKAAEGKVDEAAQALADIGGVCQETALRILADPHGEPVTVLLKALGYLRARFAGSMERLKHSDCQILHPDRNIAELESIFDTLSFNKARILLTYWDWFVQKSGPYAPQN